MDRASDDEILDKALKEHRVILTHDLDFGKLIAFSGKTLPSVVTFLSTQKYAT
jgi:predicted nuclease of predicted toxin-antitoxin system